MTARLLPERIGNKASQKGMSILPDSKTTSKKISFNMAGINGRLLSAA